MSRLGGGEATPGGKDDGEFMRRNWFRGLLCGAAATLVIVAGATPALADTLFGALEKAYVTNPTLNGARAGQRAVDEQVPQALSGWRPTVTINEQISRTWLDTSSSGAGVFGGGFKERQQDSAGASITLTQPLFNGFRTIEGTKAAKARVRAGQQNLLQTEQQVMFNVVQAYMNVYAGRQLVNLQRKNVAALRAQLKASQERFNVGEITRTDVAQARASLAQAQTQLVNAQATLASDVAEYMQLVGNEPGKLVYPKVVGLPKSLRAAQQLAGEINPRILANAFVEVAAEHNIQVAKSGLLPQANIEASASVQKPDLSTGGAWNQTASVTANLAIPIYEGGLVYSQIREAKQLASQSRIAVIEVSRAVRQAVASSWNAYVALGEIIGNAKTQVSAAQLALSGVQQEYQAGTRTTLDVLNAQTALVAAQTTLVNAEKNRVVAGYQLLASIGRLTASDLRLSVAIYDPEKNYNRVKDKWFGTGVETVE